MKKFRLSSDVFSVAFTLLFCFLSVVDGQNYGHSPIDYQHQRRQMSEEHLIQALPQPSEVARDSQQLEMIQQQPQTQQDQQPRNILSPDNGDQALNVDQSQQQASKSQSIKESMHPLIGIQVSGQVSSEIPTSINEVIKARQTDTSAPVPSVQIESQDIQGVSIPYRSPTKEILAAEIQAQQQTKQSQSQSQPQSQSQQHQQQSQIPTSSSQNGGFFSNFFSSSNKQQHQQQQAIIDHNKNQASDKEKSKGRIIKLWGLGAGGLWIG